MDSETAANTTLDSSYAEVGVVADAAKRNEDVEMSILPLPESHHLNGRASTTINAPSKAVSSSASSPAPLPATQFPPQPKSEVELAEGASSQSLKRSRSRSASRSSSSSSSAQEEEQEDEDEEDAPIRKKRKGKQEVPPVVPPFLLRGTLRPYQRSGLEWLAGLYTTGVNGILADEMGLGKTIQTISLLGYLACSLGIWGPHLVVVPTSVLLNWEMEFKKFLPGFRILTYYGNQKERKEKRVGWSKENAFNVCITSYQLILSDHTIFRRKSWCYLILDEAHHIKNFKSQRWKTLLGFNSQRRLLLTGTPLQNNLMELWSLLYFLMPQDVSLTDANGNSSTSLFANHKEFSSWFSNPMDAAIENNSLNDSEVRSTVSKLHILLRPYLLRRLKADVEKQLPSKHEYILYCRLSKRQRFLYDEFMSRAKTRETLMSGQIMNIINCLMQLRKVCNHPDLFEVREIKTSWAITRGVVGQLAETERIVRRLSGGVLDGENRLMQRVGGLFDVLRPTRQRESHWFRQDLSRINGSSKLLEMFTREMGEEERTSNSAVPPKDTFNVANWKRHFKATRTEEKLSRIRSLIDVNDARCTSNHPQHQLPAEILNFLTFVQPVQEQHHAKIFRRGDWRLRDVIPDLFVSYERREERLRETVDKFAFVTPAVVIRDLPSFALPNLSDSISLPFTSPSCIPTPIPRTAHSLGVDLFSATRLLHNSSTRLTIAFPDRSLLLYDCGKLQVLSNLLTTLRKGGHRVLIFTQMTKVLDLLEIFLNLLGHRYLRLDGSTKVEDRQLLTERFNRDDKILAFISSTRAGGLGINLTGADTVVFYDSDWNPSMDRQCQDRCHRIGQQREVSIYRLVSRSTIEENMLKKANQKRILDDVVIQQGEFTTDYFDKVDWRDMLGDGLVNELGISAASDGKKKAGGMSLGAVGVLPTEIKEGEAIPLRNPEAYESASRKEKERNSITSRDVQVPRKSDVRRAFAMAEDEEDAEAARVAEEEFEADRTDFGYERQDDGEEGGRDEGDEGGDELQGTIEGYMVSWVEDDWDFFDNQF